MSLNHQARKRFGQNFLVDQQIIAQIISAVAPKPEQNLVEIGPGMAAITEHLVELCPNMSVMELDRDLVEFLGQKFANYSGFTIHSGDALKMDFSELHDGRDLRLVGNLPYNISTPLLFHLLKVRHLISDMHFMLQREVVDRLSAAPGTKAYGRLSVMIQYYCRVMPLIPVPPESFRPVTYIPAPSTMIFINSLLGKILQIPSPSVCLYLLSPHFSLYKVTFCHQSSISY